MQAPAPLEFTEHRPTLAEELYGVATIAAAAAALADGEYIPQMPRQRELQCAWRDASHACAALQQVAVRVARMDGAADGMQLIKDAIVRLDYGRSELMCGAEVDEGFVAGGAAVVDSISIGMPGARFREAAELIRGLADLALLEAMSPQDAFLGLVRR